MKLSIKRGMAVMISLNNDMLSGRERSRLLATASFLALAFTVMPMPGAITPAQAFECANVGTAGVTPNDNGQSTATACGNGAQANAVFSTAVGFSAQATAVSSIAVGVI